MVQPTARIDKGSVTISHPVHPMVEWSVSYADANRMQADIRKVLVEAGVTMRDV